MAAFLATALVGVVVVLLATTLLVDDPLLPSPDLDPPPRRNLPDSENAHWYFGEALRVLDDPGYAVEQAGNISFCAADPRNGGPPRVCAGLGRDRTVPGAQRRGTTAGLAGVLGVPTTKARK